MLTDTYWQKIKMKLKLKYVPFHDTHGEVSIDVDDCGADGCEIDENGVAIRWMD